MSISRPLRFAALLFWSPACLLAGGEVHETADERHLLRSSVVNSMSVSAAAAAAEGIERAPDRAIINVTVLAKGSQLLQTVPARIEAVATGPAGARRPIAMSETRSGHWVSYTGTFRFAPREVVDFAITARPDGGGEPLEMRFRERIWSDARTP